MSELKERDARELVINNFAYCPNEESMRVYLKYEADAVIKELKAQKAQAEDDCVFWKKKYNDCKRELDLLKDTNAFYNGGR